MALLACSFAGNHIAARIAFDDGTGLLFAILCRSGATMLGLCILVLWRRESLRLGSGVWRWQILLGSLIGIQSFFIYSAVARIPVGLALLVVNLSPVFLSIFTFVFGGGTHAQSDAAYGRNSVWAIDRAGRADHPFRSNATRPALDRRCPVCVAWGSNLWRCHVGFGESSCRDRRDRTKHADNGSGIHWRLHCQCGAYPSR